MLPFPLAAVVTLRFGLYWIRKYGQRLRRHNREKYAISTVAGEPSAKAVLAEYNV